MPGFEARPFSDAEKRQFRSDPNIHLQLRKQIEHMSNQVFPLFLGKSEQQKQAFGHFASKMRETIVDAELREKLVPKWNVGCRRLTPGTGYMESLFNEKSSVVYGEISRISASGPVTDDGKEHPVDVLICATGFDTTFKPRFPLRGPDGQTLAEKWEKEPKSYLGLAAAEFPNYFMFLGPNCPIGNGPVLVGVEAQADYFMKFIHKLFQEDIRSVDQAQLRWYWKLTYFRSFTPKTAAVDEYIAHKDRWMERSVWQQDCRSWYKNSTGKITALWSGSAVHYVETLQRPRFEDFDWVSQTNRWSFLGNGFSARESAEGDLSWYIRSHDDSLPLGKPDFGAFEAALDSGPVPTQEGLTSDASARESRLWQRRVDWARGLLTTIIWSLVLCW